MNEKDKKQIPLRITQALWNDLSAWADDEFRSLNGQIEYLLTDCVKKRKRRHADNRPTNGGGNGDDDNVES
ncbi:MAG: Arc family DNA-binding protein [Oscillospiraceae bacterium]|nr:Arc family DNA-binding protein [Oscillospiraceae bacterium]